MASNPHNRTWMEKAAGYLVGIIVLAAYAAYGFVAVFIAKATGTPVQFPASWEATMGNLAVAALSVLLDRQLTGRARSNDTDHKGE